MPNGRFKPVASAGAGVLYAAGIGIYDPTVSAASWQSMSVTMFAGQRVRIQVTATSGTTTAGIDYLFSVTAATLPATTTYYTAQQTNIPRRLMVRDNSYEDIVVPSKPGATWIIYRSMKGATTCLRITRI